MTTPADARTHHKTLTSILDRFCATDPGRSAALRLEDGTTLHVNGNTPRPVASIMKIPLVMALYDQAANGDIRLDEQIPIHTLSPTRYCSILHAFDPGRTLSLAELAALALITSDNPIAVLLEDRTGRPAINRALHNAGIPTNRTYNAGFREHELGPANRANQLTPLEILTLLTHLQSTARHAPIVRALENNLRNTRIPALLPDDATIAHKTGSLENVVCDAGIVRLRSRWFALAFLCDEQPDPAQTSTAIATCAHDLYGVVMG